MNVNNKAVFMMLKQKLDRNMISYANIKVTSNSMAPFIVMGDKVTIISCKDKVIEEGDIILFYHWKWATLHRVVEIKRMDGVIKYQTKGDANPAYDDYLVKENEIIGIVSNVANS